MDHFGRTVALNLESNWLLTGTIFAQSMTWRCSDSRGYTPTRSDSVSLMPNLYNWQNRPTVAISPARTR